MSSGTTRDTALITGASSGIGRELAREFAAGGFDLILVARNRQALEQLAGELGSRVTVHIFAKDLAQAAAVEELAEQVEAAGLCVEVLVNNAGVGTYGSFVQSDAGGQTAMIQLNVVAVTELTRRFAAPMLERGHGRILNIASTAAFQPGPLMAVYYASKAFVLSFSEALASELRGSGVTVTVCCPGMTRTAFQQRAGMDNSRLITRLGAMGARPVAHAAYLGTLRGKTLVTPGWRNKLLLQAVRFAPRRLVTAVVKLLQQASE
jgi:short-subunit dehydrogenase